MLNDIPEWPAKFGAPSAPCAGLKTATFSAFYARVLAPDRQILPSLVDSSMALIEETVRETGIGPWMKAMRRFDDATHRHCMLVAGITAAFTGHLGLHVLDRHRVIKAALLHDVGKMHVPLAILNKPGPLNAAERAVMQLHPARGHAMLSDHGFSPVTLAVVRSHHELLDGSGYPDGLVEAEISDLVRLTTICDIYAALIERRAYKPPMGFGQAYAILTKMTGRLDPVVVRAFEPVARAFTDHALARLGP
ncbi:MULTISPECIES: HD-GYP domain-containing protein [Methylobacterium]|uniref:Cyclic di-GMP phosphodiesterase response regulator RpfG n=1 Tax=Methylobacterium bullatum TaxID=570505 RepID=A0A679JMD0_9HYPH|nr:HD domain-containing phosphohydrolase [Methylobacterium sp. Leaf85]KQO49577.1 hypothetical protein ASF08_23220 [Methylobacterium sp. Leaf85]CAA2137697.1 Cyclic di-GMP phosphodiesterase response regulator RpfG [Methylobacterium bullatum]